MFAADRDLLVLEPNVFRDVAWAGQRLVKGTGTLAGTALTMESQDTGFDDAGVDAGHVALIDGVAFEVLSRESATELTVSLLRAGESADPIPGGSGSGREVAVWTFRPQIEMVHAQVLRMLGIEPQDPPQPGRLTESGITNPGALARVEALGALHLVFAAAAGGSPPDSPQWARAEMYRERFAAERQRASARVDLDGDGIPDATRRLNVVQFIRG
jgi:hypothetical protein